MSVRLRDIVGNHVKEKRARHFRDPEYELMRDACARTMAACREQGNHVGGDGAVLRLKLMALLSGKAHVASRPAAT